MGGAVKSVSKAASKAVGGATKAVGNVVKETAKAPGVVAGLFAKKPKIPGEEGYDPAVDSDPAGDAFSGLGDTLGVAPKPMGPPPAAAINPYLAPKRAGFVLPKFNQMQARMEQSGQPLPGQPQQPVPGQPPQLNQGGMMNRFRNMQQQQNKGPQAPMAPAPGTAPAPMAAQAPAPGQPPAINPIAPIAPAAPEVKPPVQAAPAPVQQQQAPGTPAPGASPEAGKTGAEATTISPEEQFKKSQNALYQVNK